MRVGSGTRVKILEAWANRIPVVSTTVGAEGLDAVDGTHLLLADNPADFANAVERLLSDGNLRADIIDEGERRFEGRHSSHVLEQSVCKLVSELVVK